MLFKNNLTPAVAHAGYQEAKSGSSSKRDGISLMNAKENDHKAYAQNQGGARQNAAHKKPDSQGRDSGKNNNTNKERNNGKSNRSYMKFVIAIIAIIAIVIVIAIIAAIANAPGSNMKKSDSVYVTYQDSNGNWRIAVDGSELEYSFVNQIKLEVADNNTFAYITETLENGNSKLYILDGTDLVASQREAKEILAKSPITPCIIYRNTAVSDTSYCFKGENDENAVTPHVGAENFVIVPDGSAVYFTIPAVTAEGAQSVSLQKYKNATSTYVTTGFIPLASSADGEHVYLTTFARKGFAYVDTSNSDEYSFTQVQGINNNIYGNGITAINVKGNQVIIATEASDGTVSSYFYEIGDDAATPIGTGIFTSVHYDPEVLFEDSLLDSYFEVENSYVSTPDSNEDGTPDDSTEKTPEGTTNKATYFLNSKKECLPVSATTGKFSPDGKYFYYIDTTTTGLKRVSLSSKKFDKHESMPPNGAVADFYITQKGDLYILIKENKNENVLSLNFVDASTTPSPTLLSTKVDEGSISISVNTLYFTETTVDETGANATKVYATTNGSNISAAEFEDYTPTQAPIIAMGSGNQGYATFATAEGNKIFYTSNGKSFDFLCDALPTVA